MELVDINYAPKYKIHCQVPGLQKKKGDPFYAKNFSSRSQITMLEM